MSPIKQEYKSSVETHMFANQKVWGSILSQGMPSLFCPVLIDTSFTPKLQGKTHVKHRRYTRNLANRVQNGVITCVLASLSSCFGYCQHGINTTFYM